MITERERGIYRDLRQMNAPAIGAAWAAKCMAKFLAGPFHSDIVSTAAMLRNMNTRQLQALTGMTPRLLDAEADGGVSRAAAGGRALARASR